MNKIILVRPKNDVSAMGIPLGLLHVGTVLSKEGYTVTIIDAARQPDYKELLLKDINNALIIGITCLSSEVASAIEISDHIKSISKVPVIWGGCHPTLFPEQVCSDKSVDFVCVGEGEYTILELVKALESGGSLAGIGGLAYKDGGVVRVNPQKGYVNLETLPPVDYALLDISKYVKTRADGTRSIPYQSSRGCPHRCKFCVNIATANREYRTKSPGKVVDDIQLLVDRYGMNYVDFYDDNFFVNIKRARQIAEGITARNLNIKWFAECRIDYFRDDFVDEELLSLAQKSGLSQLTLGAESGSQRVLDSLLAKDITVEQILNSASMLSHFDIQANYSFIIGIPGETGEEMKETAKLAHQVYELCPQSMCAFVTFTPYPGSEITEAMIKKGFLKLPSTLREWANNDVRELYYDRFSGKPWHEDARFISNLIHYAGLAYFIYPSADTEKWWLRALRHPFQYRGMPFVLAAQLRMKHLNFSLPVDKLAYNTLLKIDQRVFPR